VRQLAGHAGRALTTVADYLAAEPATEKTYESADRYFAAFLASQEGERAAADEAVAQRGVQAGLDLGDSPVTTVRGWADEVYAALKSQPLDRLVATRFGGMALGEYLRTRLFELVVHGLDLARATGQPLDIVPASGVAACLDLAVDIATHTGQGTTLLLALTGREPLPPTFALL